MPNIQPIKNHHLYNLIIFDCDGVLVDSEVISCSSVAEALTKHGARTDIEYVIEKFLGRPSSSIIEDYEKRTAKPAPPEFIHDWRSTLFSRLHNELDAIPHVRSAIEAINMKRCVASSSDMERLNISLTKTNLINLFCENIFSTTMVKNGKPAPDLFLLAAKNMGTSPDRCVVIEDSPSGIKAAKSAEMLAIGFTGGSHYKIRNNTEALTEAGADYIIDDMRSLPKLLGFN